MIFDDGGLKGYASVANSKDGVLIESNKKTNFG
jgi:hypothetical protein